MLEFFRHLFGLCGEGHPSILYGLGIIPFLGMIKRYFVNAFSSVKNRLKRHP